MRDLCRSAAWLAAACCVPLLIYAILLVCSLLPYLTSTR